MERHDEEFKAGLAETERSFPDLMEVVGFTVLKLAASSDVRGITDVAPYAAFGAFYFLLSALWLTVSDVRRRRAVRGRFGHDFSARQRRHSDTRRLRDYLV